MEGAGIHNLNDVVLTVADGNLTVDIAGGAIEVNYDGEVLFALAVEGINEIIDIDNNVLHEGTIFADHVQGGGEGTALLVLLNLNSIAESPAAC